MDDKSIENEKFHSSKTQKLPNHFVLQQPKRERKHSEIL
jgi:hypothetical protein